MRMYWVFTSHIIDGESKSWNGGEKIALLVAEFIILVSSYFWLLFFLSSEHLKKLLCFTFLYTLFSDSFTTLLKTMVLCYEIKKI